MRNLKKILVALSLVSASSAVFAATTVATVNLAATITASCNISTTTGTVNLTYSSTTNQFTAGNAILKFSCTPGLTTAPVLTVLSSGGSSAGLQVGGTGTAIPYGIAAGTLTGSTAWPAASTAITAITTTRQTLMTATAFNAASQIGKQATLTLPVAGNVYATTTGTSSGDVAPIGSYADTLSFTLTY